MRRFYRFIIFYVLFLFGSVLADWTVPIQVNEQRFSYGIQACRDTDCSWGIAADNLGNIHFVIETKADSVNILGIHYRLRKYENGAWSWDPEISVTYNEPLINDPQYTHNDFGHPSIIFDNFGIGMIGYVMDKQVHDEDPIEMRSVDFDFNAYPEPFDEFYFMSEERSPFVKSRLGGAKKTPVMSIDNNGLIYCYWPYYIDGSFKIYGRTFNYGFWSAEFPWPVLEDIDYEVFAINTLADPNGDIHLAIDISYHPGIESREIYHCRYDVSEGEWSEIEIVSELSQPDGNHSTIPYMAFRQIGSEYKMYIVWQEYDIHTFQSKVVLRIYDSYTDLWDTEIVIADENAELPCVAVQSNGDIYVVWHDIIGPYDWIFYKWYDNSNSTWSARQMVTHNPNLIWLHTPTIICDNWDNLHLVTTGEIIGTPHPPVDYEAFYSFWDAPPHAPQNLAQLFSGPPENITITWDANTELDLAGYMIIRRYNEKPDLDTLATVDDTVTTYVDEEIPHVGGETANYVRYWIEAIDAADQHSEKSDSLQCAVPNKWEPPKLVADGSIPTRFELVGNYPNPFNASTQIQYALSFNAHVTLEVYDILGRKTATLIDEYQEAGYKTVRWNGLGDGGMAISTGIYIYRLSSAGLSQSKRMLLVK